MIKLTAILPVCNQEELVLRAIKSIPCRDDIEIIVIDDYSSDGTYEIINTYTQYSKQNIILLKNENKLYVGGSINKALEIAKGEYVAQIDSDDYVDTVNFNELLDMNRTEDLLLFHNQINDGSVWEPELIDGICDHVCWYKRSIVGDTRQGDGKWGQGWNFHQEILSKSPTKYYFDKVVYYYNYPRENSNFDLGRRGLL